MGVLLHAIKYLLLSTRIKALISIITGPITCTGARYVRFRQKSNVNFNCN